VNIDTGDIRRLTQEEPLRANEVEVTANERRALLKVEALSRMTELERRRGMSHAAKRRRAKS
jgi:hypothetical protein